MNKNISIIGVGRLGICVALCLEKAGYNVVGVDVFPDYVDKINNKTLISPEPEVTKLLKESKNFKATSSLKETLEFSDMIFIYVATPSSGGNKHYDHTMLGNVLTNINKEKVKNKHIIIGCTVIPGYINQIGNFLIKDCENTTLSYNPEFIAQGDIINGLLKPDFILIGEGSEEAGDKLEEIYRTLNHGDINIQRMSPISAEITKLSVNCFITTKIAFANMIGDVADSSEGADKFDILRAVGSDSRIGSKYLKPGYGFGGPCFPRDNRALGSYIKSVGIEPLIPLATDESNQKHTKFQTSQIIKTVNENEPYIIKGVGYKDNCNVPIIEESQKLIIGEELIKNGYNVILEDKEHMLNAVKLEYGNIFAYRSKLDNKYLYNNDENYPIFVTDETLFVTPYTFMKNGEMWESESITSFYKFIDNKKSYNIIDVGAQTGLYSLYAKYLPSSTFYSFEPFPQTYKILNDNLKLNNINNVKTYNIAMSNTKGKTILNTCKSHNGLHTMGNNVNRFNDIVKIDIETDTIDNLFFHKNIPVNFIKIDTEGHEFNILKGALNTIKTYKPIIQLEWNFDNLNQNNVKPYMLLELIYNELNYKEICKTDEELIIGPK